MRRRAVAAVGDNSSSPVAGRSAALWHRRRRVVAAHRRRSTPWWNGTMTTTTWRISSSPEWPHCRRSGPPLGVEVVAVVVAAGHNRQLPLAHPRSNISSTMMLPQLLPREAVVVVRGSPNRGTNNLLRVRSGNPSRAATRLPRASVNRIRRPVVAEEVAAAIDGGHRTMMSPRQQSRSCPRTQRAQGPSPTSWWSAVAVSASVVVEAIQQTVV